MLYVLIGLASTIGHCKGGVRAFLNMPKTANVAIPKLLSDVRVYADSKKRIPIEGAVTYDVNVPFWSDGASKQRWMALPMGETIGFSAYGAWKFPAGTVFVKEFDLQNRPIETRLLVRDAKGGVYGGSYRWRNDGSDADLVTDAITVPMPGAAGGRWYFPSSRDCRICHTAVSGGVLGVRAEQLDRAMAISGENQLITWQRVGLFGTSMKSEDLARVRRLVGMNDPSQSVEIRARSFLAVNCANCHQPGGVSGYFDARFQTPLEKTNLIDGPVLINLGIDHARTIAPRDVWRSIILNRVETSEGTRMPPLGHFAFDPNGAKVLRQWIMSMAGKDVLPPPAIEPPGGEFNTAITVKLAESTRGAEIHYTVDGSLPVKESPIYSEPLRIADPTTLRARAFKDGMTTSIATQQTFIVDDGS